MKTKVFVITNLCWLFLSGTYAQYIPNGGFENWENRILYAEPMSWNTGNMEAFINSTATALRTDDHYYGAYALRLQTVLTETDTLLGYAFCEGMITEGGVSDTFRFTGGMQISGAPDSLFGIFKYHIADNDTAIVLASFKKDGVIVGQEMFTLAGDQSSYVKMGWEIGDMAEVPDTAMIAFACSNPDNPQPGGWMQVDSIWFGGIGDTIPNAGFEIWEETSCREPEHWLTANLFTSLFGGDTSATSSADAHSGSYALRIESVQSSLPTDSGMYSVVVGFAIPYATAFMFGESMPVITVDFNPTALTGFYKFEPLLNDTAMIVVNLTDTAGNTYPSGTILLAAAEYTPISCPLTYPAGVKIAGVTIVVSTSTYFMPGDGKGGEIGSVLYLDDLDLLNPCDDYPPYSIAGVQQPLCADSIAVIDAGDGWAEYLWSTGDTTQIIHVHIAETTVFSVTVTAAVTGCQFSDEVTVSPPVCVTIEGQDKKTQEINIYPNPSTGIFFIEFSNVMPGNYTSEIMDITGKVLLKEDLLMNQATRKVTCSLSGFPKGLYLVKISGESFSQSFRLMKN
ncbi:MAG: T9SS type A sorting domain-containing protein [Bacteroidales bacterium]|nr:T9SS type A sorting domain-containing protein [Bacteroidales bacterium]